MSLFCISSSIPGKRWSFFIIFLRKGLSLCFMCSDLHAKHWKYCGFPLTNSLLLDYHVNQYTRINITLTELSIL